MHRFNLVKGWAPESRYYVYVPAQLGRKRVRVPGFVPARKRRKREAGAARVALQAAVRLGRSLVRVP